MGCVLFGGMLKWRLMDSTVVLVLIRLQLTEFCQAESINNNSLNADQEKVSSGHKKRDYLSPFLDNGLQS